MPNRRTLQQITELGAESLENLHRYNSNVALQAAIELMLTDRSIADVRTELESWLGYLSEFD